MPHILDTESSDSRFSPRPDTACVGFTVVPSYTRYADCFFGPETTLNRLGYFVYIVFVFAIVPEKV
jgi:hypothetical protein